MGGLGSGHNPARKVKRQVENHLAINIRHLTDRLGEFRDGEGSGTVAWERGFGNSRWRVGSLDWISKIAPGEDCGWIASTHLELWDRPRETFERSIIVQAIRPHWGGRRWFLTCGHVKADGTPCYRRVEDLFLIDGEFICRHCGGMNYRTSQSRDRDDDELFTRAERALLGIEDDDDDANDGEDDMDTEY